MNNTRLICASSTDVPQIKNNYADFTITCPPYWNLERYDGGKQDLSMCTTYTRYLRMLYAVIRETYRILKPDTLSCWVVGLIRDKKSKELLPIHHDLTRLHKSVGFSLKEEIVLHLKNTGSVGRVGNFERGNNFLIRTHEYLMVYKKPNLKEQGGKRKFSRGD